MLLRLGSPPGLSGPSKCPHSTTLTVAAVAGLTRPAPPPAVWVAESTLGREEREWGHFAPSRNPRAFFSPRPAPHRRRVTAPPPQQPFQQGRAPLAYLHLHGT